MAQPTPPRVLLVDDSKVNRRILTKSLSRDYQISAAPDGPTALEIVRANPPDLILLDIVMPGMDGYEVCRRLAAERGTREIPVIFLSSMDDLQDKTTGFALGAVDYITKPFEVPEVKARVGTHLALVAARKELRRTNEQLAREIEERKQLQAQLVQSEKQASIGTLAAGIAHEVNNPTVAFKRGAHQLVNLLEKVCFPPTRLAFRAGEEVGDRLRLLATRAYRQGLEGNRRSTRELRSVAKRYLPTLEGRGVSDAANLSRALARTGIAPADLDALLGAVPPDAVTMVAGFLRDHAELGSVVQMMRISADRIVTITQSLKRYAHLDRGPESSVDLQAGIEDTLALLHNELQPGVEVVRRYTELPSISGHPGQLAQVWTNLLLNAAQATRGRGRIEIQTFEDDERVGVRITDDGPGIPAENQGKVFDPFFTTKDQGQGTGLGLSICAGIIKNHGGEIRLESRPGRTTFEVRLPRSR